MSINCQLRCRLYDILEMIGNKITLKFVFLLSQSSAGKTALKSSVLFYLLVCLLVSMFFFFLVSIKVYCPRLRDRLLFEFVP